MRLFACLQVKVVAVDGAQTQVNIIVRQVDLSFVSMVAEYIYYGIESIASASETHIAPVVPPRLNALHQGVELLESPLPLDSGHLKVGNGLATF